MSFGIFAVNGKKEARGRNLKTHRGIKRLIKLKSELIPLSPSLERPLTKETALHQAIKEGGRELRQPVSYPNSLALSVT